MGATASGPAGPEPRPLVYAGAGTARQVDGGQGIFFSRAANRPPLTRSCCYFVQQPLSAPPRPYGGQNKRKWGSFSPVPAQAYATGRGGLRSAIYGERGWGITHLL